MTAFEHKLEEYRNDNLPLDLPQETPSIIKVIGVGGGGSNAVNHMYRQGIADVSFVVCNTDNQALRKSPVPLKIQLGTNTTEGLGAGGRPEKAREAAQESMEKIREALSDNTKMVFITAGMGGGTGTGAAPVVAHVARELNILTVGIVTIPFLFEGNKIIEIALRGIAEMSQFVDALLVINNEKLREIYPDLTLENAFAKADDVLTNAAKGIAEIITVDGYINTDFADVYNIMKDGKLAIMNSGYAEGDNRIEKAIKDALHSPLLKIDKGLARKILMHLYCSHTNAIRMDEIQQVNDFMQSVGKDIRVSWGITYDDNLGDSVKITIVATGYEVGDIPGMPPAAVKEAKEKADAFRTKTFGNLFTGNETQNEQNTDENATSVIDEADLIARAKQSYYTPEPKSAAADVKFEIEIPNSETADEIIEKSEKSEEGNKETETLEMPETASRLASFDEMQNEEQLREIEKIPAWKRKLGYFKK
jgi:cell division protein FtsZ